jgi:fructose-1,6-bisphosphatase
MNYRKNKNASFSKQLEELLEIDATQNYIPLYNRFFQLNDTNWNSINLDHPPMKNLEEKE